MAATADCVHPLFGRSTD